MRVFSWDADPSKDQSLFKQSTNRAKELVRNGLARMIVLPCGRKALQMYPPAEHKLVGGGFDTSWAIKQSGYAGPLTWQLNSARSAT
jgi:hypothetical protein